jgi:hypothetical protein
VRPQRFTAGAEPIETHGTGGDDARFWPLMVLRVLAIVGMVAFATMLWRVAMMPTAMPATTTSVESFTSPSAATWPAEVIAATIAISTFTAPTTTPSPIPTSQPTATVETLYCGIDAHTGQSCQWPPPTPEMPTPLPICQTPIPTSECEWRGNIAATPVTINGDGKGT